MLRRHLAFDISAVVATVRRCATTPHKEEDPSSIVSSSVASSSSSSQLSLLQPYTAPGAPRRHPLTVLEQVAAAELTMMSKQRDDQDLAAASSSSALSLWSVEELQLITADAARRAAAASRRVVDDDADVGAVNLVSAVEQHKDLSSNAQRAAEQQLDASIGASLVAAESEAAVSDFAKSSMRGDAHATHAHHSPPGF